MKLQRLVLLAVAALAGCGGGSGGGITPATPAPLQSPPGSPVNAQFSVVVPAATSAAAARVKRQYMSAATRSLHVALQGGATLGTFDVSAGSKLCASASDGTRTCTFGIAAPSGSDTFAITAYDQPDGTGNALASGEVTQTISTSGAATIKLSLTGVTSAIRVSLQNSLPAAGKAANIPVTVQAVDADGNTILGAYDRTITLADNDASGHTSLSATSVTSSSDAVTLSYDGGTMDANATISASAPGIQTPSALSLQAMPSVAAQYDISHIASQDGTWETPAGTSGIVQGPDGNFWIAASTAGAILKMTPGGQITTYWPPTPYAFPQEEVVGKDGAVWFTERDGNNIGRISMSGAFTEYAIPTQYSNPLGIAVGPDGNIWFVEQTGDAVGKVDAKGTVTEYPLPANSVPTDLTAGPDGNLWIDESGWNQPAAIGVMSTSGAMVATHALAKSNAQPYGIIAGPDGNLWFGEYTGGALARMTPSGQVTEYTPPSSIPGVVSVAASKDGSIWFAESGASFGAAGTLGYIKPGSSTVHEVYLNVPLHVRNITFDSNGALWYSGFYYDDSNVGEVIP